MTDKLREAAQAIVDRWDSPAWGGSAENLRHTGEYIAELRAALAQQDAPSALCQRCVPVCRGGAGCFAGMPDTDPSKMTVVKVVSPVQQDAQAVPQSGTCKQNLQVEKLLDDMLVLLPYNSPDYWIERIKEVRYKRDDHLEDHLDMVGQQPDAQEKQS